MTAENLPILPLEQLPQTDPAKPEEKGVNYLQEAILEWMDRTGNQPALLHKEAGIAYPTLSDWILGEVRTQLVDKNLFNLWRVTRIPLPYLLFGVGPDEEKDDVETMMEMKKMRERVKVMQELIAGNEDLAEKLA